MPRTLHAQNEHQEWYFGYGLGLDFHTSPPTLTKNAAIGAMEGSASICHPETGELLFYTDGVKVWNRDHVVMPNGFGLYSEVSSTQAAVIIPKPGDPETYYIFTVDQSGYRGEPLGINYSTVFMPADNGRGDVIQKNINLLPGPSLMGPGSTERITAVKLCNGAAYWVIGHELGSSRFYAWYVDANGVRGTTDGPEPVISHIGTIHGPHWDEGIGWMSASPDGTRLAVAFHMRSSDLPDIELYKFDPLTGVVSEPVFLQKSVQPYGAAFSPSGKYLYASSVGRIEQFDISTWEKTAIENTQWTWPSGTNENGAIKPGPDGKLYVQHSEFISIIEQPDQKAEACNYHRAIELGQFRQWGLPNNVDAHFKLKCGVPEALIKPFDTLICVGECVSFYDSSRKGAVYWEWAFEGTGINRYIGKDADSICYNTPGTYKVTLIASNEAGADTAFAAITVRECPVPNVSLTDTTICRGEGLVLTDTSSIETTRTWTFDGTDPGIHEGQTTLPLVYDSAGTFRVTLIATNEFGADTAVALVTVQNCPDPIAAAVFDSVVCIGEAVNFTDRSINDPVSWEWTFDGATPPISLERDPQGIVYDQPGMYTIRQVVTNTMDVDTAYHTIRVSSCKPPEIILSDYVICEDDCIEVRDSTLYEPTTWEWTIEGAAMSAPDVQHPGTLCYPDAGEYQLRLIASNAYGADTVTRKVTVLTAAPSFASITVPDPIDLCSFIDTFITITAGCRDLTLSDITSQQPELQLNLTAGSVIANGSFKVPFIIAPTELGSKTGTITFIAQGKTYSVQVTYTGSRDPENFAFGDFNGDFETLLCDVATRELTITNQACAEQQIVSAVITPSNTGFSLQSQVYPLFIPSMETRSITVIYDAALQEAAFGTLRIVTQDGQEQSIPLTGRRILPTAGVLKLEAPTNTALLPNEKTAIRLSLVEAVDAAHAPETLELTLGYNTDLLTTSQISARGGWKLESRTEASDKLTLLLSRPQLVIDANTTLLDIEFESFLTTESETQLAIESIRCNPGDPQFESCVYRIIAPDTSRVAMLQVCGDDELQRAMGKSNAIELRVFPHPVKAGDALRFTVKISEADLLDESTSIELVDLSGKIVATRSITSTPFISMDIPIPFVSAGVYVLKLSIGGHSETETIVIE